MTEPQWLDPRIGARFMEIRDHEIKAYPIHSEVLRIEKQASEYADLCGRMLATLCLPQNQPHIPDSLKAVVAGWKNDYEAIVDRHCRPIVPVQNEAAT